MNVYLVRFAGTTKISGIFWASNIHDLFWTVDEMGDPGAFEFTKLTMSGGIWNEENEEQAIAAVQLDDPSWGEDDDEGKPTHSPFTTLGESPAYAMIEQATYKWKTFGDPGQYYGDD